MWMRACHTTGPCWHLLNLARFYQANLAKISELDAWPLTSIWEAFSFLFKSLFIFLSLCTIVGLVSLFFSPCCLSYQNNPATISGLWNDPPRLRTTDANVFNTKWKTKKGTNHNAILKFVPLSYCFSSMCVDVLTRIRFVILIGSQWVTSSCSQEPTGTVSNYQAILTLSVGRLTFTADRLSLCICACL